MLMILVKVMIFNSIRKKSFFQKFKEWGHQVRLGMVYSIVMKYIYNIYNINIYMCKYLYI